MDLEKALGNKAIAVLIKIRSAFTGFYVPAKTI